MIMINTLGLLLIALIVWWFWLYKPPKVDVSDKAITIIVENGTYLPSRIKVSAEQPVTLQFLRKDESPCAGTVLFPDFDINEELPVGKEKLINLPAIEKGEYPFHCQMQMYRGTLLVE